MSFIDTPVRSVMTRQVRTVEAEEPLTQCVRTMRDARIGCVVVVEGGKPIGMFTERDLISKIADAGAVSLAQPVGTAMARPLTTILPSATLWDAISLMGRLGIRRLPVVEEEKLVGILTERDIFRLILSQQSLLLEAVSESMPAATRDQLRGIVGHFGPEKLP
ncbi:MAG: CBS domain-containing protein [Nitrososphaerales archaeon]